jgi:hypothetical protein
MQIQGNCPFKANDEASDTESVLKLGIQTDILKNPRPPVLGSASK